MLRYFYYHFFSLSLPIFCCFAYLFSVFLALFDLFPKLISYLQTFWQPQHRKSLCNLLLIKSEYTIPYHICMYHTYSVYTHSISSIQIVFSKANKNFAASAVICFPFSERERKAYLLSERERERATQIDQKCIILC